MVYNRGDEVKSSFFHRRGNWGTERWCALSPSHYKVVVSLAKAQTYSAPCTLPRIQHPCYFLVLSWAQLTLHTSVLKTWRFLLPFICPSPMVSRLPALENGSAAPSVMYLSLEPGGCCPLCVFTGDTITWGLCAIGVWILLLPLTSSAIFWSTWVMSGIILNVRYCKVVVVYSLGGSCGQATFIHGALQFSPFPSSPPPYTAGFPVLPSLCWPWLQNSSWCSIPRGLLIYPSCVWSHSCQCWLVPNSVDLWVPLMGWKTPRAKSIGVHGTDTFSFPSWYLLPSFFQQHPRFLFRHGSLLPA